MPITLRNRPTCHYCGKRNGPTNNQRKFTCQYCEAENYLDESGQVADVPASAATTPRQYAIPVTPAFEIIEGSIFCSTCQKNQYMYNTALSEYLPDPDHPEYDKFEDAIPAFKKELERRFPTCCANCEPKVKAQLQQATYNARSDHLRRVLDRSRQRRNANLWGWRSLLVNAAGLGWLVSLLLQLVWHALGSQMSDKVLIPNMRPTDCLTTWPVPIHCPDVLEWTVGPALLLGISCLWWNPRWQHKLEGREGRLVQLDKFYKVQAALLSLRFAAWIVVKDVPKAIPFRPALHTVSLVLIAMVAGWSRFSIIKIYVPQIVDWSQDPAPLLDSRQYVPPTPVQNVVPSTSQQPIPVNIFDTTASPNPRSWRLPTPPIDEDAMEWDPTPASFSPAPKQIKYKSSEPTPFQGTLTAFPQGGIYHQQRELVKEQPKAIGLPIGFFDKSHGKTMDGRRKNSMNNTELAQPKFFPNIAHADTGLENIFDQVFSLRDEAMIPTTESNTSTTRQKGSPTSTSPHRQPQSSTKMLINISRIYNLVMAGTLTTFATLFSAQCYLDLPILSLVSTSDMLRIMTVIPLLDIVIYIGPRVLVQHSTFQITKIVLSLVEAVGLFVLNYIQPDEQSLIQQLWNKLVIASIAVLLVQQIYSYCIYDVKPVIEVSAHIAEEHQQDTNVPLERPVQVPATPVEHQTVRRSSSDESLASTASIATTSTASGWKTPQRNHREELRRSSNSASYGFGGLSLKNDHGFGTGNTVAGARDRRPGRGGQRGNHSGW